MTTRVRSSLYGLELTSFLPLLSSGSCWSYNVPPGHSSPPPLVWDQRTRWHRIPLRCGIAGTSPSTHDPHTELQGMALSETPTENKKKISVCRSLFMYFLFHFLLGSLTYSYENPVYAGCGSGCGQPCKRHCYHTHSLHKTETSIFSLKNVLYFLGKELHIYSFRRHMTS